LLEVRKGVLLGKGINREEMGEEGRLILHQLEQAVAATGIQGAALRIGTVGPKDGVRAVRSSYEAELVKQLELASPAGEGAIGALLGGTEEEAVALSAEEESNCKLIAWSTACVQGLRHRTGAAALGALVRSERVASVLGKAVEKDRRTGLNIAVRRWDGELRHEQIFRGVVRNGRFNALSQFNQFCFFPSLLPVQEALKERLVEFWEAEIAPKAGSTASYLVDLAAHPAGRVSLVNLHQYGKGTSASLFDWEADRQVLEQGPFQFRVREEPMKGGAQFVEMVLKETEFDS